jgi:L-lactate dehydrogenase complex protein LldG
MDEKPHIRPETMTARDAIFSRIRGATGSLAVKRAHPSFDPAATVSRIKLEGGDTLAAFARNLTAVNGRLMSGVAELAAFLRESKRLTGYCDPALLEIVGKPLLDAGLEVDTEFRRDDYERYEFGITRATGAIAESGSLILDDHRTSRRLAALSPWVHVAVVSPHEIFATIPEAIAAFDDCPNIIWATGPSKTADVEGILIEGVHGPGEQIALVLDI